MKITLYGLGIGLIGVSIEKGIGIQFVYPIMSGTECIGYIDFINYKLKYIKKDNEGKNAYDVIKK